MQKFFDMDYSKKCMSIAVLRCMATFFITNTHLDQVYPTDKLAIGGLIGDVLFFMISGFCLINSRENNFIKWYLKRFFRVYPAVFIMILVNLAVGYFAITNYFN